MTFLSNDGSEGSDGDLMLMCRVTTIDSFAVSTLATLLVTNQYCLYPYRPQTKKKDLQIRECQFQL